MQTITYKDSVRDIYCIFRSGVDENFKAIDEKYHRLEMKNIFDKVCFPIFSPTERIHKFFRNVNHKDVTSEKIVCKDNFKLLFDKYGRCVLYRSSTPDPKKFRKCFKTKCSTYNEWTDDYIYSKYNDGNEYIVEGYDFKSKDEYIIFPFYHLTELLGLIPEVFDEGDRTFIYDFGNDERKILDFLWNLPPIDLNRSWDYTEEYKERVIREEEERKKDIEEYYKELEIKKNTPGYCSVCGCPNASYVIDPYLNEMYGSESKVWLCHDCYKDSLGDI